jgi:hypothetical protein
VNGKFAPPTGKALLLVGQDKESVDAYFDATVTAPGGVAVNTNLQLNGIEDLDYLAGKYPNSAVSVGVDLKGIVAEVADGKANEKIDALLDMLTSYNRPIFLRLGHGFDDPANGYAPDVYVSAWKNFEKRMQAKGSLNGSLMWEVASCEISNIADYYPGDELIDWIGTNYQCADEAIQLAREHFKPVMLTASSQGAAWDEWFVPFFKFVADNNDVVRAVTYINEGDGRLSNADTIKNWKDETKESFWLRANPSLFETLGFAK